MADFLRYSDEELESFRELINDKMEQAKEELKYYHEAITHQDLHGTDDTYSALLKIVHVMSKKKDYIKCRKGNNFILIIW